MVQHTALRHLDYCVCDTYRGPRWARWSSYKWVQIHCSTTRWRWQNLSTLSLLDTRCGLCCTLHMGRLISLHNMVKLMPHNKPIYMYMYYIWLQYVCNIDSDKHQQEYQNVGLTISSTISANIGRFEMELMHCGSSKYLARTRFLLFGVYYLNTSKTEHYLTLFLQSFYLIFHLHIIPC